MHSNEYIWFKEEIESPKSIAEISSPVKAEEYNVERTYKAKSRSEVSVRKDAKVLVVEKSLSGWWLITTQTGEQGSVKFKF